MSHQPASVFFSDGSKWWGEYDGTTDIMLTRISPDWAVIRAGWRQDNWTDPCDCAKEPCGVSAHYGGGVVWKSEACREHGYLVGGEPPDEAFDVDTGDDPDTWYDRADEAARDLVVCGRNA